LIAQSSRAGKAAMNVWLIYREEDTKKNAWYIKQYLSLGAKYGMDISLVLTEDLTLLCLEQGNMVLLCGQEVNLPELAIVRTIDPLLSKHLETAGITVVNNSRVSEICNDKARTYQEIASRKLPMVPTTICKREDLKQQLKNMTQKTVVKTVDGHGGQEVFLLDPNGDHLAQDIQEILTTSTSDFVIQPMIGVKHQDLRVYVLGNQILAAILRTSKVGFKANYSLGGDVVEYYLSEEETKKVHQIIEHFCFDLVGIDFIVGDDNTLIFNEIEDVVGARMLYECTSIDIVDCYLRYLKDKF
jgi:RimK family alpha-L-glutamate ligase